MENFEAQENSGNHRWQQIGITVFDQIMKQMLVLGQSSLSKSQFRAFRRMTMDLFADGKRILLGIKKDRCGESKEMVKGVVKMDG
jgi:hypothetical protein